MSYLHFLQLKQSKMENTINRKVKFFRRLMRFMMTTSMNHPIMLIGLQKVYSKLAHSGEIFFYFVVPAQLYNSYKKQNFVTTNNVIAQRMPAWIKNRVKQYALKNDLSTGGLLDRTSSTATIEK